MPPTAPFFILGSQGSGSTLLRLMLDSHERLAVPPETGVMRLVTAHRWVPFWTFGGDWYRRLGMTEGELDQRLGEFYGAMFDRYAAAQGKVRWGEKTPFHIWHVDEINRVFPDAVFLGIVRHPLGAVASMRRRFDKSLDRAVRHWLGHTRELVRHGSGLGDRFALVRYEELTTDPSAVMREVLDWLGEPWSDRVVEHHEAQPAQAARVEGGTRPDDAVDPSRIDRWRKWFDDDERRRVLEATLPWAELVGYDADPSVPPRSLSDGGHRVVTGVQLAARMATVAGLAEPAPDRPPADDPLLPKGRRRRRQALRRDASRSRAAAQDAFEQLPPAVQRRLRGARRRRRRNRG